MTDTLSDRLSGSGPTTGRWVSLGDSTVAELYAELDSDLVVIDTEHAPASLESVADCVRAVDAADADAATVVRVPDDDPASIKRVLDLGIDGLMVPMVDTVEQAAGVIDAVRYPPEGGRGVAATRSNRYGLDLATTVNGTDDRVTTIVQIESDRGVENAPDIAAVDGIDSLFIGPADLSTALGELGNWDAPGFVDAVERIIAAGREADVPVGTLAVGDDQIRRWAEFDFSYVVVGYDVGYLTAGVRRATETYEAAREDAADGR